MCKGTDSGSPADPGTDVGSLCCSELRKRCPARPRMTVPFRPTVGCAHDGRWRLVGVGSTKETGEGVRVGGGEGEGSGGKPCRNRL